MEHKIKLSIEEIYSRMQENDPDITKGVPNIFKSPVWSKYRCIFYKGHRQDFAQCNSCGKLMLHKARTGNSQLLRHKCATAKKQYRVPNERYDDSRVAMKDEDGSFDTYENDSTTEFNKDESLDEVDRAQVSFKQEEDFHEGPVAWVKVNNNSSYNHHNNESLSPEEIADFSQSSEHLSREELSFKIAQKDAGISFSMNHEHPRWKQFASIFYNNIEQHYLRCVTCGVLLRGDKRTSIASLSRHKCLPLDPKPMSPLFSPSLLLQAKLVYKSLRSPELFDDPNFADFCASLVDNQTQPELANRRKMTDKILPLMVDRIKEEIRAEIRTVNACLSYELWNWDEHRKIFTLYADWINHEYQLKRYCLGTVLAESASNKINLDPLISAILKDYMDDVTTFKRKKCVLIVAEDLSNAEISGIQVTDIETVTCSLEQINQGIVRMLENPSAEYLRMLKNVHKIQNLKQLMIFLDSVITTDDPKFDMFLHALKILKEFGNSISNYKETTVDSIFLWKIKLQKHFTPLESDEPRLAEAKTAIHDAISAALTITDMHKISVFLNPKFKHLKFISRAERNEFEDIVMSRINEQLLEVGLDPNTFEIRTMSDTQNEPKGNELFAEFMETNPGSFTLADSLKNEVRQYMDTKINGSGDLLPYWRHSNFEDLRKLVRKYLMIPACSIQSRINYLNLDHHLIERRKALDLLDIQNVLFLYHNMP
ncbi:uncharacterized protein LOC134833996 [Culicoides brevitarsis]|uniref:uncharacterized protein LOC134833996 n=1 Tax=Culicoides brevitarsis TaxID=469753 RepID=UPI00307B8B22